jgi:hypothetical protein
VFTVGCVLFVSMVKCSQFNGTRLTFDLVSKICLQNQSRLYLVHPLSSNVAFSYFRNTACTCPLFGSPLYSLVSSSPRVVGHRGTLHLRLSVGSRPARGGLRHSSQTLPVIITL